MFGTDKFVLMCGRNDSRLGEYFQQQFALEAAFSPKATASAIACMFTPSRALTTSFIVVPEPLGPRWKYCFAKAAKIGSQAANVLASPPPRRVKVPCSAAGVLPEMATS